ncbi:MAG: alpha-L-rhamnosidase [Gemmatimonadetes bacterium]|nr:MAG: alpha-L-rhamnosidase [Gemmatimonadota bacterium]
MITALAFAAALQQAFGVTGLRVEHLTNPLGIDVARPRLSWRITSAERNTVQAAYQLQVTRNERLIWDTGRTSGDSSVFVVYAGPDLESRRRYAWRVRVWDAKGRVSPWSAPGWWEVGLLQPSDWAAAWIGTAPSPTDSVGGPSPLLRRAFRVSGVVTRARLYATSLGLYEVYLNGARVGDQLFTPGWTSYHHRVQYQTYDVTKLLKPGDNAAGAVLGDGWYRGQLGFEGRRNVYGRRIGLRLQLEILYQDGRIEHVSSDSLWKTATGPIQASDIYGGETYDARLERPGWAAAPYDDSRWRPAVLLDPPAARLVAPEAPPVRRVGELKPIAIRQAPSGETILDLGQNFTGWARLKVRGPGGPAGTVVTMRFAEVLDRDGNLYVANLRRANQTDRYTLKGGGEEIYEPHFTFHGFRYVGVTGLPARADSGTITGIVVSSDLPRTGSFETSDSLLNRLQQNIVWGQRSNFLDVPTDCPQRDERLGWTGDAQVFAPTAAFNMDVAGFFAKWLADLAADQDPSGSLPWVIPDVLGADSANASGTAGWSDATVIVPWMMYVAYGDRALLERQYQSMRAWVEFERRRAGPDLIWRPGWQFGDWLALHSDDPSYPGATTSTDFIATAYFAHSTDLVARSARVLGKESDAGRYGKLFQDVKAAFNREFVSSGGRVGENTQTAYALAIAFDLLPDSLVSAAAERLAASVRSRGMHLTTGFLGTPQLLPVLSATGHLDVAYELLLQRSYPSWLYPITRGATTMWERWDGIRPDSTFEDAGMNSFNHYAFGAVGDWMYRTIGGIQVDPHAPGGKRVGIAPRPGGGLTHASASLETGYGKVASSWKLDDQRFVLAVSVPPNTMADVTLWETTPEHVSGLAGVREIQRRGPDVVVTVGSGDYQFTVSRVP